MNTNGSIYSSIMKAADSIERNPKLFNFMEVGMPNECGTPGCALGWIAHHACKPDYIAAATLLGIRDHEFYARMAFLCNGIGDKRFQGLGMRNFHWKDEAAMCARILRLYAAKYHAPEKPAITGIPDSIRAIFVPGMRVS